MPFITHKLKIKSIELTQLLVKPSSNRSVNTCCFIEFLL
jgi:hypothetical protein